MKVVKGHLIGLPRSQGNPNNGTKRGRSPFLWPLLRPGLVLCMPKGLRKLPLPKATQGNSSKANEGRKGESGLQHVTFQMAAEIQLMVLN